MLSVTGKSIHDQIFKMLTKLKASKKWQKWNEDKKNQEQRKNKTNV